ncbi:MAG: 50S ribosomal protein L6 [Acidobacteriota bacterium]
MSRVGRKPIEIPKGVKVEIREGALFAEGPKGKVKQSLVDGLPVELKDGVLTVTRGGDSGKERAMHGLARALYANAVKGVAEGFSKALDIVGVGYKAEVKGAEIHLALGYSHPVIFKIPAGIKVEIDGKTNRMTVSGADRQVVGQVSAELRGLRRPDPYKGKGIKYSDEILRRKVGKAGAK